MINLSRDTPIQSAISEIKIRRSHAIVFRVGLTHLTNSFLSGEFEIKGFCLSCMYVEV